MSSPRKRHVFAAALAIPAALLALAALPAAAPPQEATEEPAPLPVLYYSVAEVSPDYDGDARATILEYGTVIEKVEPRITVSAFNQVLGAENARYHMLETLPDVFSLRFLVGAWNDGRIRALGPRMTNLWVPGSYRETVLVPCASVPVRPPAGRSYLLVHRSARAKIAAYASARQAAVELTDYVNEKSDDVWVQLYENLIGETGTLHWFVRTVDLATWHRVESSLLEDPGYLELYERTFTHCIEGSVYTDWGISMFGP